MDYREDHDGDLTESGKRRLGNANSGTACMTQQAIGEMFGVSLQSIQAVEYRALRKIRQAIRREAEAAGVSVRTWLYGDE